MPVFTVLDDRGVLRLTGEDRVAFLQGLVSNDVERVAPDRAVFSAFLTPQGKYLHDFHIVALGDALLLDCEAARAADLMRRLRIFRLRARVEIADATADWAVAALLGREGIALAGLPAVEGFAIALEGGVAHVDARLAALGARALLPRTGAGEALRRLGLDEGTPADWDALRLSLGVPDGSRDLVPEKAILLESNYDALRAIAWDKGCYMGQELTARTRYRGLIKKRLIPVAIDGPAPAAGARVHLDGREIGEMRSSGGGWGIALLRLEALATSEPAMVAGEARLSPRLPDWLGPVVRDNR